MEVLHPSGRLLLKAARDGADRVCYTNSTYNTIQFELLTSMPRTMFERLRAETWELFGSAEVSLSSEKESL